MQMCWKADPKERPTFGQLVEMLSGYQQEQNPANSSYIPQNSADLYNNN